MRSVIRATRALFLSGVLAAGSTHLRAQQAGPKDTVMTARTAFGWPVLDRLTALCSGRVYGAGGTEISWEVFTSPAPLAGIVAAYRSRLRHVEGERSGDTWRFRAASGERTTRVLEIRPTPPPILHGCPAAPADAQVFVVFSQMMVRR
jgi:hypothetical protein